MIKFRQIRPFIYELLVLLFVFSVGTLGFIKMKCIEIVVHPNFLFVVAVIVLLIAIGRYLSRVINWGVRAFFDFALQRVTVQEGFFEKQFPFCASSLLDTRTKDGNISKGMYYIIEIQSNGVVHTLLSTTYLTLESGKEYIFQIAASSSIILDVGEKRHF